jgi:signal transduction histidine kinase
VDVAALIDEAVEITASLIESRRHTLNLEIAEGADRILGDPRAVLQILLELLSNAARFTDPGGTIEVRTFRRAAAVVLEVQDSGPGIEEEALPHLFQYYATLGAKHRHRFRGPGVGLALTRSLALRLGGTIGVVSVPGRGTTFRVQLPVPAVMPVRPGA